MTINGIPIIWVPDLAAEMAKDNRNKGWETVEAPDGWTHVIPLFDLKLHDEQFFCHCGPKLDDDGTIIIHRAYDGRQ